MPGVDFDALLYRPVTAVFGRVVSYVSPDGMVSLSGLMGRVKRMPVALDADAENSGGITQMRDVLRINASEFPEGVEPEQGALVTVFPPTATLVDALAGTVEGERSLVTDVLTDARGWHDLPLAQAPG